MLPPSELLNEYRDHKGKNGTSQDIVYNINLDGLKNEWITEDCHKEEFRQNGGLKDFEVFCICAVYNCRFSDQKKNNSDMDAGRSKGLSHIQVYS